MRRHIIAGRERLSDGNHTSAGLFGSAFERRSFEDVARRRADAPQTAGVVVTIPPVTITILFCC